MACFIDEPTPQFVFIEFYEENIDRRVLSSFAFRLPVFRRSLLAAQISFVHFCVSRAPATTLLTLHHHGPYSHRRHW